MSRERIVYVDENTILSAFTTTKKVEIYYSVFDIMKCHTIDDIVYRVLCFMQADIDIEEYKYKKNEILIDIILGTVEVISNLKFNY